MRCRIAASSACSLLVACAISACGGGSSSSSPSSTDNGVAAKAPGAIVAAALGAINTAKSAHIAGNVITATGPVTLDLALVSGRGGRGQMSRGGLSFNIEVLGNEVYLSGSPAFWDHFGATAFAKRLHGKWLKAPTSGQFASLAQLGDLHRLLSNELSTHGAFTKTGVTTVNGQRAVGVRNPQGTTIYVATTGKPYPIEVVRGGGQSGRLVVNNFDAPVALTPPSGAVDVLTLK